MINVIDRIEYLPVKAGTLNVIALGHHTVAETYVGEIRRKLHNYPAGSKTITLTITGQANDANSWQLHLDGCDEEEGVRILEKLK